MDKMQNLSLQENGNTRSSSSSTPGSSGYQTPRSESLVESTTTKPTTSTSPTGVVQIPFLQALPSCKPVERPALTEEQNQKYVVVLNHIRDWDGKFTKPPGGVKLPLSDSERMWLTRECILRYLRATNWSPMQALKRLGETIMWRRDYEVESISADMVSEENETGKQVLLGFDNNGRPCLYLNPGRQNTKKSERQIKHLVFMLERTIDMMGPGQETSALLINFKNASSGGSPSVSQGRQVMTILQGYYPERLGRALISELPWFIATFFRLISPFIDPATKEKMIFNGDLTKHVPLEQLDKEYGGKVDFQYDHKTYWPALAKMCEERRAAYAQRWNEGGKLIGEYEAYLRGGDHKSLAQESN